MTCNHIDLSAFHAAIGAMSPSADIKERSAAYKAFPGVKCHKEAEYRVVMYADHEDDDSQVHVCTEHVAEWDEDEYTAIFCLKTEG